VGEDHEITSFFSLLRLLSPLRKIYLAVAPSGQIQDLGLVLLKAVIQVLCVNKKCVM
jgi:hypothetical protein